MKKSEENEQRMQNHLKKWEIFAERACRELLRERGLSRKVFETHIEKEHLFFGFLFSLDGVEKWLLHYDEVKQYDVLALADFLYGKTGVKVSKEQLKEYYSK